MDEEDEREGFGLKEGGKILFLGHGFWIWMPQRPRLLRKEEELKRERARVAGISPER
ncbi:hypothetical protein HPP92_027490 [Vanilla planifolia]|uniref:Uncharacterized protein n=1 Tax=Vanilla planifolia TaxID=51239 RepID=A0A835PAR3_VANPL|nr:hypothetical protein HPP92_027490 [Vanilla planifolia]